MGLGFDAAGVVAFGVTDDWVGFVGTVADAGGVAAALDEGGGFATAGAAPFDCKRGRKGKREQGHACVGEFRAVLDPDNFRVVSGSDTPVRGAGGGTLTYFL